MAGFQQECALPGYRRSMAKGAGASWARPVVGRQAVRCGLEWTSVLPGHCGSHMADAGDWAEGLSAVGL